MTKSQQSDDVFNDTSLPRVEKKDEMPSTLLFPKKLKTDKPNDLQLDQSLRQRSLRS